MNLDEMIRTDEFDAYREGKLGNDLFINDPDRANRIYKAAEHGADGSTHAEIMGDWMDFLDNYAEELELSENECDNIKKEIWECWDWHDKHGSLFDEVG